MFGSSCRRSRKIQCISYRFYFQYTTNFAQVGNDLQQTRALENLQEKLQSIQSLTQFVADQVVLVRNDIKNFSQVVASVKQEANATKLERQDMPSIPPIFFGRDKLVEKMSKLLSLSETALHMCFLGPGGMGKTSIALAIVGSDPVQARFQEEHRVWVPCSKRRPPAYSCRSSIPAFESSAKRIVS